MRTPRTAVIAVSPLLRTRSEKPKVYGKKPTDRKVDKRAIRAAS